MEGSPNQLHALLYPSQTILSLGRGLLQESLLSIKAASIITDAKACLCLSKIKTSLNPAGLSVFLDVREPFLSHTVERHAHGMGKLFLATARVEVNRQPSRAQLVYQKRYLLDAGKWLLFGSQRTDGAAHILQGLFHHALCIAYRLESFLRPFIIIHQRFLQLHANCNERMTQAIMNVARDPVALFCGREFGDSFGIHLELPMSVFYFRQEFFRSDAAGLLSDAPSLFEMDNSR